MIEIKGFFSDWHEVDIETARRYVACHLSGVTTTSNPQKRAAMVDGTYLRGITVRELIGGIYANS